MGKRAKDGSHSSHRQGEANTTRLFPKNRDRCVDCGAPVHWEEALSLDPKGTLWVCDDCVAKHGYKAQRPILPS